MSIYVPVPMVRRTMLNQSILLNLSGTHFVCPLFADDSLTVPRVDETSSIERGK